MTRHFLIGILAVGAFASLCGQVWAQGLEAEQGLTGMGGDASYGSSGVMARAPSGQATGVLLSESSVLHVGIGAEGGYDTNVFYTDVNPVAAPLLRVVPFIELTNATRAGAIPSGVYYDLAANLQYREYLSDNDAVKAQRAFNPGVTGYVEISSGRSVALGISNSFVRIEDAPYTESEGHITRDSNVANVQLRFAPGGGRLRGTLRYTNALDVYETPDYERANNMGHQLLLDGSWLWLPKTALYLQVAQGYIHYLGDKPQDPASFIPRNNSTPLRTLAGLRGLLTQKVSLNIGAGYANAFYSGGDNTAGISNLAAMAELTFRPSVLTNLLFGYRHEFRNSIIGTFYDVDSVYVSVDQRVASRLNLVLFGKYELRRYAGLRNDLSRTDNFAQAGAKLDYYVQEWFYAGLGYSLFYNKSDLAEDLGGVTYTKQLVLGRIGFVY